MLEGVSTLVFVHAHPDDEGTATAGSMIRASREGHRVVVVYCTDGDPGDVPDDLAPGETVVFSVLAEDGTPKTFEREIVRYVKIKLKGGGFVRRPVIRMHFCIAGRAIEEEVNLANRENFVYPVLVGRNMMAHADLVVNPNATFLTKPQCKSKGE